MIPDNVEVPDFNPELQYLGEPTWDEKTKEWFFPVIDYSESDLKAIQIYKAEFKRQKALSKESEKMILADTLILSDSDALEKQSIFPIWEKLDEGYSFKTIGEKFQSFDENKELGLFSVRQAHTKQSIFPPLLVPALWNQIKMKGSIEIWTQQLGNTGKYPYLDPLTGKPYIVSHKDSLWENTITSIGFLNTYEPGVFGWKKI